jgi:hypothetical protein
MSVLGWRRSRVRSPLGDLRPSVRAGGVRCRALSRRGAAELARCVEAPRGDEPPGARADRRAAALRGGESGQPAA